MKKLILSALMVTFIAIGVNAQDVSKVEKHATKYEAKHQAKLAKMTPEERAKFEEKLADRKAKWDALTPEEKAAKKGKHREMRERLKNMAPDERKAAKAEMKANRYHKNG